MNTVASVIQVLAVTLGSLAAIVSILFFVRLHWPAPALWFMKLYASALSPMLLALGLLVIIVGLSTDSIFISILGLYVSLVFFRYVFLVTRPPAIDSGFEKAFGPQWEDRIKTGSNKYIVKTRTILKLPSVPAPRPDQNIPFATIPGTERNLICDIWQPHPQVMPSGVALIYLHGSAFYFLDKDFGTRPFFRHLTAQGHLVMDVAYRLAPETDFMGMVNDVKRAIAWMKEHASSYGVNPDRIILAGGSAGGHLALLAAYTAQDPRFTPPELAGKDLSVCAVVSLYGTTDLEAVYYHTNQHLTTRSAPGRPKKAVPTKMPGWIIKKMGEDYHRLGMDKGFENAGALAPLLGGHPDECPETYALFSPVNYVHPQCPPTLLIHGEHDIMAPVTTTGTLYSRLAAAKVLTILHLLPQTEHAFDLVLPGISPSVHTVYYEVERFITLVTETKATIKKNADAVQMQL